MNFKILGLVLLTTIVLSFCNLPTPATRIWYVDNGDVATIRAINPADGQEIIVMQARQGDGIASGEWSPDGKHLVYNSGHEGQRYLNLAELDRLNQRTIIAASSHVGSFWLDNSSLIGIEINRKSDGTNNVRELLYDVSTEKTREIVAEEVERPNCYVQGTNSYHVMTIGDTFIRSGQLFVDSNRLNLAKSNTYSLPNSQILYSNSGSCSPRFSKDGRWAFSGGVGLYAQSFDQVMLTVPNTQFAIQLTDFSQDAETSKIPFSSISPNGEWVIFSIWLSSPKIPKLVDGNYIALVNTANKKVTWLAQTWAHGDFVWSPDSNYVAGLLNPPDNTDANAEIFIIDIQTQRLKQMTFNGSATQVIDWR